MADRTRTIYSSELNKAFSLIFHINSRVRHKESQVQKDILGETQKLYRPKHGENSTENENSRPNTSNNTNDCISSQNIIFVRIPLF